MTPAGIFSIPEQFRGVTVLLTGATGYVGGLLLEALLRTTSVEKVYVLLRSKGDQGPQERLQRLLQVCFACNVLVVLACCGLLKAEWHPTNPVTQSQEQFLSSTVHFQGVVTLHLCN